jgi:hypothetical protein
LKQGSQTLLKTKEKEKEIQEPKNLQIFASLK